MFNRKRNTSQYSFSNPRVRRRVNPNDLGKPSYSLIIVAAFLTIFGLLMVFSASAMIAYSDPKIKDAFYYFNRQIIWIIAGVVAGFIFYKMDLALLRKLGKYMVIISIALMIFMLPEALSPTLADGTKAIDLPLVNTLNGATRWYNLGIFSLQPAEILKIGIVIFTAAYITQDPKKKKDAIRKLDKYKDNTYLYYALRILNEYFLFCLMGFIAFLILAQRDLDTLAIIFLIFLTVYFVAGEKQNNGKKTLAILISAGVMGTLAMIIEGYRRVRFLSFLEIFIKGEPSRDFRLGESFQVWNGLVAIGSGGLFGLGYNESRQKLFFLQEAAYTDSIFAVLAEEFGLLGTSLVILAFVFFLSVGLQIARSSQDKFTALIATGVTGWISIQAFLNIAANLAAIPFGGMPLPFFTYGGSNTVAVLIGVGILLNISRRNAR